jgi:hypothetical protein
MPRILNNHFREIEIKIVSEQAWSSDSPVVEIINEINFKQMEQLNATESPENSLMDNEGESRDPIMQPYNMFFKRVLHLAAQRIFELCESLGIRDDVKERAWTIMKVQLSTEPGLLINRHLDQLVMCTVYGVCKV